MKDEDQEYGKVLAGLGDRRMSVKCFDNKIRVCHIRGSMKRVRMNAGDYILVSKREFDSEDGKADIIHKYFVEEVYELMEMGEIPEEKIDIDASDEEDPLADLNAANEASDSDEAA